MKERLKTIQEKLGHVSEKMKKGYQSFCEKGRETNDGFLSWFHQHDVTIYLVIITLLALVMRALLFPCVRGDYTSFLLLWYRKIYLKGGPRPWASSSGTIRWLIITSSI